MPAPVPVLTPAGVEPAFDLAAYYPLLIYVGVVLALAAAHHRRVPRSVPQAPQADPHQADALRVRHGPDRRRPAAVRRQVLPDRHPVPRLRRRTAVPLPVGGGRLRRRRPTRSGRPRSGRSSSSRSWSSSPRWPSPTSTPGGRGCSNGGEARLTNFFITQARLRWPTWCASNSLWPMPFATACCGIELMATGVEPVRHRPLRRRGDALQPAAVRPDDRRRPGGHEDGAGAAADLAADARAEVVHLDGGVRLAAAACSTPTPSCRGSTASSRWTCTCPAARRGRSS